MPRQWSASGSHLLGHSVKVGCARTDSKSATRTGHDPEPDFGAAVEPDFGAAVEPEAAVELETTTVPEEAAATGPRAVEVDTVAAALLGAVKVVWVDFDFDFDYVLP